MNPDLVSANNKRQTHSDIPNVRTLLFCRVSKNYMEREFWEKKAEQVGSDDVRSKYIRTHKKLYEEIDNLNLNVSQKKSYFAFGSFDALCVYKTPIENAHSGEWFKEIYKDKQNIVKQIRPDLLFHQMHLIRMKDDSSFWEASDKDFPFFLVTCIYGVKHEDNDQLPSSPYCSKYEENIDDQIYRIVGKDSIRYSVYNGISISDVVVLWKAKNLAEVLRVIPQIVLNGTARKTLTTISFPMQQGEIQEETLSALKSMGKTSDISLSIRGAIRSASDFQPVRESLQNILCVANGYQNFGVNDFTIEADVNGEVIAKLLDLYTKGHDEISACCWEIHTDLKTKYIDPPEFSGDPTFPSSILYKEYEKFLDNCERYHLDQYPWCLSLRELLATNSNIDRNPVLHGPSYLVYYTLRIINAYLSSSVTDFSSPERIKALLLSSEKKLLRFVRGWDQLTEQIIRNDDVILGGRNNSHTIHISLPESALDFYHAFLRRGIELLVECDKQDGGKTRVPDDFEFDLLLIPDKEPRFQVSQLFVTDTDQKPQKNETENNHVWPERQAYLLELPMDSIFSPMDMIIPVIHECCHLFGDVLRKRRKRRKYMAAFMATDFITNLEFGGKDYRDLQKVVTKMIYGNPNTNDYSAFYMKKTCADLKLNLASLLGSNGSRKILDEYPPAYYLFSDDALYKSKRMADRFGIDISDRRIPFVQGIVDHAEYFFKECYADAMTIALLNLKPTEYLERFIDEVRRHDYDNNLGRSESDQKKHIKDCQVNLAWLAQRVAIVLAACSRKNDKLTFFSKTNCRSAISEVLKWPNTRFGIYTKTYKLFSQAVEMVLQTLLPEDQYLKFMDESSFLYQELSMDGNPPCFLDACHPPASLKYVQDYLEETIQRLFEINPQLEIPLVLETEDTQRNAYLLYPEADRPCINSLSGDFNMIIREGQMFGARFYQLIHEYHSDIQTEVRKDPWPKSKKKS